MPIARIICFGWADSASGERHPCGKVLGYIGTEDGSDSHGMCVDCFRAQMTAAGFTQEQIEETLGDSGVTEWPTLLEVAVMAMTKVELEAQLDAKKDPNIITYKISNGGAVSVYGLGRFPGTLYKSQWDRLLEHQNRMLSVRKLGRSVEGKLDQRYKRTRIWLVVSLDKMGSQVADLARVEEYVVDRLTVLELLPLLQTQEPVRVSTLEVPLSDKIPGRKDGHVNGPRVQKPNVGKRWASSLI